MATQFQNAFSDNALKNLIILLVLSHVAEDAQRQSYVAAAGALFAAPFILLSMFGGWLADRFSKASVMSGVKIAELGIMLLATLGFFLHNLPIQLAALFLMGCHSAIFGPSKYGILPELLPIDRLSWGNGILELLTFLGIILGTVAGSFMAGHFGANPALAGVLLTGLALSGLIASRGVPRIPSANPTCPVRINPVTDLWREMLKMRADRDLWRANWGNTGFFFIGALVQMNLVLHAKGVLHLSETQNGLLNASLAIGIGVGSILAGYASRGKIEYRLIPAGSVLMALSTAPMGLANCSLPLFCLALVCLGIGAGLFIVPIAAVLQHRPSADSKGAVQGAASVISFVGILGSSGVQIFLNRVLHLGSGAVFWFCGAAALLAGTYVTYSRRLSFR